MIRESQLFSHAYEVRRNMQGDRIYVLSKLWREDTG